MERIALEVRFALRTLRKNPGFTAIAVATLALGIGATLAIFSVLHSVVLSPLPYAGSERLVRIENRVPGIGPEDRWGVSPAGFFHFREHSRALEDLGVYVTDQVNLTGNGEAERVQAAIVSASLLHVLGARPTHGRILTADDDRPGSSDPGIVLPGPSEPVAVLGHHFWMRRYGGDPGIVGRAVEIDGRAVPVVGVLEPGFDLPEPGMTVDVWMPLGLNPAGMPTNWHTFNAVGRLRPGVTIEAAQAELQRFTDDFVDLFPGAYSTGFMEETGFRPAVTSLRERVVGELGRTLWVLFAAVGLVLLIASANVANLFLARTEGRRREIAIRSAIGATSRRLAAQFLSEGVVLALLGSAAGLLLAHLGVRALIAAAPEGLPRLDEVAIGSSAIGFAGLLALLLGLAIGVIPLLRFGSAASEAALREGGRSGTEGRERHRARSVLVVGQVSIALVLLVGAGLLMQSFQRLRSVDPGLVPDGVLTLQLTLPFARYQDYRDVSAFYEQLTSRLEALPNVQRASVTSILPLTGGGACSLVFLADRPVQDGREPPCVPHAAVSPGYFEALRIPIAGRAPDWGDVNRLSGEVVVSRALADRFWPGEDPIGKRLRPNGWGEPFYRVVGVTGDVRYAGLDQPPTQMVYYPLRPMEGAPLWMPERNVTLVVRASGQRPQALTSSIRAAVAELDPSVPLANVRSMEHVVALSTARTSFAMLLLGIGAAMALLLSTVGLYAVVAYIVGQRTQEIGIRMALGARAAQVAEMVVRHSLRLVSAGIVLGLSGALVFSRVLRSLLFEISPTDPLTLAAVSLLLLGTALFASYLPARRAARVDPMTALRAE